MFRLNRSAGTAFKYSKEGIVINWRKIKIEPERIQEFYENEFLRFFLKRKSNIKEKAIMHGCGMIGMGIALYSQNKEQKNILKWQRERPNDHFYHITTVDKIFWSFMGYTFGMATGYTYSVSIPIIAMYHLFDKTTKKMV